MLKHVNNERVKLYLLVFWVGLIWTLSSMPGDSLPDLEGINLDKLAHLVIYMILSILVFKNDQIRTFKRVGNSWLLYICIFQASIDEAHQIFIKNRSVSVLDLSANMLGILIGFYLIHGRLNVK